MAIPTKEQVRQWQEQNRRERRPPPDAEQIRRELGWYLIKHNIKDKNK